MNPTAREEFTAQAFAEGFDEVLKREWPALTVLETQHLVVRDSFALERDVPHAKRYGQDGTVYWVAWRN